MSKRVEVLRALVSERLSAAAEEIFALVERTISEYEEELCRCRDENQRNQQLLQENQRNQQLLQENQRNRQLLQENQRDQQLLQEALRPRGRGGTAGGVLDAVAEEDQFVSGLKQEDPDPPEQSVQWEPEELQNFSQNLDITKTEMNFETQEYSQDPGASMEPDPETWRPSIAPNLFYEERDSEVPKTSGPKRPGGRSIKQCVVCEKVFGNAKDLKRHLVVHTGEKPYSCSVCGKRFTRKGSMMYHMAVHTGDRPFRCSVCSKMFSQKGNLQAHMALHTGDKPFSCSECGARFSSQPPLIRHKKLHSGARPFNCAFCDKGFTRNEHLQRHIQTHTGP